MHLTDVHPGNRNVRSGNSDGAVRHRALALALCGRAIGAGFSGALGAAPLGARGIVEAHARGIEGRVGFVVVVVVLLLMFSLFSLLLRCLNLLLCDIPDHLLLPLRSLVQEVVIHVHVLPQKARVVVPKRLAVGLQPGVSVGAVVIGLKRLATYPASFDHSPELLDLLRVARGHVVGLVGIVVDVEEIGGRARLAVLVGPQLSSQIDS